MNYKLSKREQFLLKALGIIGLVAFVVFIETKLIDGINQSRNDLFQSLDKFNQTKQSLAQLKDYEQNIKNAPQAIKFETFLEQEQLNFIKDGNEYVLRQLEESAVIKILNYCEEQRMSPTSFQLSYDTDGVSLSITLDD
ncbi:MAG: hypothetical protein ACJ0GI_01485 [Gammaproteobacteria bacterium]|tara:strand:- start:1450 stop:1866 length:417 start_codon:yes stop_codon:yes gene_type:complete